ncbi:MAG: hypothetical protein NT058_01690 [Candidatus Portnoybacteria bacterium]|nr:hypothetical protein [Candidatus Portnoybacteria bacterium]
MPQIIFNIQKAGERGRSPIEVIVKNGDKTYQKTTDNTDKLLLTLDKVLKSAKLFSL